MLVGINAVIRQQGETARLKAKCNHASKLVEKLSEMIGGYDLKEEKQVQEIRELADAINMYLVES